MHCSKVEVKLMRHPAIFNYRRLPVKTALPLILDAKVIQFALLFNVMLCCIRGLSWITISYNVVNRGKKRKEKRRKRFQLVTAWVFSHCCLFLNLLKYLPDGFTPDLHCALTTACSLLL